MAPSDGQQAGFNPKRVLILTKLTRYEFERLKLGIKDDVLVEKELMKQKGAEYSNLLTKHKAHQQFLQTIVDVVRAGGEREVKVIQRWDYTPASVQWADLILTAGGDGTFLLGASKVLNRDKPVIGVNTDPVSSEGYLCLMKKVSADHFKAAFDRIVTGNFEWLYRQRIRVTLRGKNAWHEPIEIRDKELFQPENRWIDHLNESADESPIPKPNSPSPFAALNAERRLPVLALNEVFVGESVSSRLSYYEQYELATGPRP